MKIFGWLIESPNQHKARELYRHQFTAAVEEKAALDAFQAYLTGVKDGMRLARQADSFDNMVLYMKTAKEYNPKNIN
jgi:hypothetical protein